MFKLAVVSVGGSEGTELEYALLLQSRILKCDVTWRTTTQAAVTATRGIRLTEILCQQL